VVQYYKQVLILKHFYLVPKGLVVALGPKVLLGVLRVQSTTKGLRPPRVTQGW
jgi:hypothetical protein